MMRSENPRRAGYAGLLRLSLSGFLSLLLLFCGSVQQVREKAKPAWSAAPSLVAAVSNNAVAVVSLGGEQRIYSFLGIGPSKDFRGITRDAWVLDGARWRRIPPVPGARGRLAATAVGVEWKIFLFGGYTVSETGEEVSVPNVDVLDPLSNTWSAGTPMPVPVDDTVSGVWRDRMIYLVSGWSLQDNVPDVQMLDVGRNGWLPATPIPGPPVFGHAGAIVGDTIVYCDGVKTDPDRKPRFVMSNECYRGDIHPTAPAVITWTKLAPHPGAARYRMAAGAVPDRGWVIFAGGTENPYNYDGVGYDGVPSSPTSEAFAYDVGRNRWIELPPLPRPSMDHRGLAGDGRTLYLIGGMGEGRRVLTDVLKLSVPQR